MRNRSKVHPTGGFGAPFLAALLLLGCGHTDPITPDRQETDTPFDPSAPQRLTYNEAADRGAAWLADGSGLVYSAQQADRTDNDVCLALLPPTGGSQRNLWCDVPAGATRTDAVEFPAPRADGGLAFVAASSTIGGLSPITTAIALGPSLDPRTGEIVRTFPYTPAGSAPQDAAEQLRWVDETRLAYLGQQFRARVPCMQCPPDTLRIGQAVTLLDVSVAGAVPLAVPGTATATGVATEPGTDAVYYTVGGDARVFRHTLSTGVVEVVHDFGAAGVARDIHIAARRLTAVVGGRVTFGADTQFGPVQWDSGGVIHVVDLDSGEDTPLDPGARLYRRPSLSPAGDAVIAEGYPLILVGIPTLPPSVDTTVGKSGDLFLYGGP